MNNITIAGRISFFPKENTTIDIVDENGNNKILPTLKFGVAVADGKKVNGEWIDQSNFFNVATYGNNAINIKKYFEIGDGIIINGKMKSSKFKDKKTNDNRISYSLHLVNWEFGAKKLAENETKIIKTSTTEKKEIEEDDIPF